MPSALCCESIYFLGQYTKKKKALRELVLLFDLHEFVSSRLLSSSLTGEGGTRKDTTRLVFFRFLLKECVQLRDLLLHLLELESCRLLGSSLTEEGSYLGHALLALL